MNNCVSRFFVPIFLTYIGFILLGSLVGLAIGLVFIIFLIPAIIIGFFIGLALAFIAHAIILIIINKTCYKNTLVHPPC